MAVVSFIHHVFLVFQTNDFLMTIYIRNSYYLSSVVSVISPLLLP